MIFVGTGNVTIRSSGTDGTFSVSLPSGSYSVNATALRPEQGTNIRYSKTFTLSLTADTSANILMDRVNARSVKVYWDPSQRVTLNVNQTAVYNITVTNTGDVADIYNLAASATGWNITPSKTVKVTMNSITFTATSSNDASVLASTTALVTIVPRFEVNVTQAQVYANDGTNYRYQEKINNNGNIDDTYLVNVTNRDQLSSEGWNVSLKATSGLIADQINVTASGQSYAYFEFSMVPNRLNPSLNPTVNIMLQSAGSNSTSFNYTFSAELPNVNIPSSGLTVSGDKTSSSLVTMSLETTILVAIVMVLFVLLIYLSIKKGVFTRRKR
jgi:hypothetical protein